LYDIIGPGMVVRPGRIARKERVKLEASSVVRSVAEPKKREGNRLVSGQVPATAS
jgi:hypothetical protein